MLRNHLVNYPVPANVSYAWGFGSLAGLCLVIQILTGIFLAMHYSPGTAFASVEHIMRDVQGGWFIRYLHANGASMFFFVVYCHIFRGLYYGSTPLMWRSGLLLLLALMGVAFMGYVLPWGQMSFWGSTVITSLVAGFLPIELNLDLIRTIPFSGLLWGGFSVGLPTLIRFYSLHYIGGLAIAVLVFLHLLVLHEVKCGSSNPFGFEIPMKIPFTPYFIVKDIVGFLGLIIILWGLVSFYPNVLGHPDNYIEANALITPAHIVPEWYLLPFYAILRSIPNKILGILAMFFAVILIRSTWKVKQFYWFFVITTFLLGWVGQQPVEEPYVLIGRFAALLYAVLLL